MLGGKLAKGLKERYAQPQPDSDDADDDTPLGRYLSKGGGSWHFALVLLAIVICLTITHPDTQTNSYYAQQKDLFDYFIIYSGPFGCSVMIVLGCLLLAFVGMNLGFFGIAGGFVRRTADEDDSSSTAHDLTEPEDDDDEAIGKTKRRRHPQRRSSQRGG